MDFDLFNHTSGYFRPILVRFSRYFTPLLPIGHYKVFFDHLSRILALLTSHRAFRPVITGKIYIFDVVPPAIKGSGGELVESNFFFAFDE
jgi:hypothetical protein